MSDERGRESARGGLAACFGAGEIVTFIVRDLKK
jgi:hypothetical protein